MPEFETVYDEYFSFVWSSVRRLGVGSGAIDDVVQEIFVVIHSKLHTLRQPESLRSWIYSVVRRTVSAHWRSCKKREVPFTFLTEDSLALSHQPGPHELSEQNTQVALLAKLLSGLSETKREVFILAELEEMTAPEIAEALNIPLNTAYSRLRLARQDFEAALMRHLLASKDRGNA